MTEKNTGPEAAIKGVVEDVKGKAKEAVGTATGRNDLIREGHAQQDKADAERDVARKEAAGSRAGLSAMIQGPAGCSAGPSARVNPTSTRHCRACQWCQASDEDEEHRGQQEPSGALPCPPRFLVAPRAVRAHERPYASH
jgi:uncharacterized protein YjbJ (UPF0337 family)